MRCKKAFLLLLTGLVFSVLLAPAHTAVSSNLVQAAPHAQHATMPNDCTESMNAGCAELCSLSLLPLDSWLPAFSNLSEQPDLPARSLNNPCLYPPKPPPRS